MSPRLIVNADDCGLTPGVSAGIRRAHLQGILTTTTVMMNMPDALPSIRAAREEAPGLGLGVHLVLTAGRPLSPAAKVRSITLPDGRFGKVPDLLRMAAGIRIGELKGEWRAQIDKFLATGAPLDHLDSHHHSSYLTPALFESMLELASEYDAPVRLPFAADTSGTNPGSGLPGSMANSLADQGLRMLAHRGVPAPDMFFVDFYADHARRDVLIKVFDRLGPSGDSGLTAELMCHPALVDDDLRRISSYADSRQRELEALTDPSLRSELERRGIQLTTFAALKSAPRPG